MRADVANPVPGGGRGACPLCRPPTLPPRCLVGWHGGFGRLLTPPLACFSAPIPPPPLPLRGRGNLKVCFAGGFAPGTPALDCLRHRDWRGESRTRRGGLAPAVPDNPAAVVPEGELAPGDTGYPCPGGEDHLKRRRRVRRIVPSPPVPPLLGCRHCSPVPRPNRHAPAGYLNATSTPPHKRQSPPAGTCLAGSVSAARVQPRGCKGRSPLHKKTKNLPPSRREGG